MLIMRILGDAAESVFKDVVKYAAASKAIEQIDKITDKHYEKTSKEQYSFDAKLVIKQRIFLWRNSFDVYDGSNNKKYKIKGEIIFRKQHMHVYDLYGKKLGTIKRKFSFFSRNNEYKIEMAGENVGAIRRKYSIPKVKYEVDFNGWMIEKKVWGTKYRILQDDRLIGRISGELLTSNRAYTKNYFLELIDSKNELLGLLLLTAIDADEFYWSKINSRRQKGMA